MIIEGGVSPRCVNGQVGARLSRAQDVIDCVVVPGTVRRTVSRLYFLYIAADVENPLL